MENVNEKFNEFVNACILSDDSLLTTAKKLFTKGNVELTASFLRALKPLMDNENKEARKYNNTSKNDKKKTWGIGHIFDGTVFNEESFKWKEKDKHVQQKDIIIQILLHCNWLMYLCSDRQHKQSGANQYYKNDIDNYFKIDTAWDIGATFSGVSMDAMLFIVELINKLKPESNDKLSEHAEEQPVNAAENIIKNIEKLCNNNNKEGLCESIKWEDKDEKSKISSDAIVNILLYLCDNERYLPIPAQNKKEQIYENMKDLAGNIQHDESLEGMSETDRNLYKIRKKLQEIKDEKGNPLYSEKNPFWRPDILPFWNESKENLGSDELPVKTLLQYKKAMVLYGPPGTSKSYQARQIAESMIAKAIKREKGHDLNNCIKELKEQNLKNSTSLSLFW